MRYFLGFFLLLLSVYSFGQDDRLGVITLSQDSSIQAKLLLKSDQKNSNYITFTDHQGIKHRKNPDEILGFKTEDGDLYLSRTLDVDGQMKIKFCHVLTEGYAVLLTAYIEEKGIVKLISIDGKQPVVLKHGMEVNTLTYLFSDCKKMSQEDIANSKPQNTERLATMVVNYSKCVRPETHAGIITVFSYNKMRIHPGLFVGVDLVTLKNKSDKGGFDTKANVIVGVNCDFMFGKSFALTPALMYSKNEYYTEAPSSLYPESIILHQNFSMSRLQGELGVKVFVGQRTWRPYFSAAPVFTLLSDMKLETRLFAIDGSEIPTIENTVEYYTVGFRGAFGVNFSQNKLNSFAELRYGYEQVNPEAGGLNGDEYSLSSIQFVVGISF
jgi:hypothetical protein